ncbi:TPA: Crp/Fnr family transcriptional regulator [Clostridium botulinum]|uniref:Crp/Fnr family transcriptional regulator n=1 Tax=Clostridium botulinum TaxID=1491 RepID=UPI000D0D7CE8|nr:Crp/Fnr family transcriptional regulator [Clostridium botulinum]PSM03461.1 Crp/Fnr family transcriptional regulator [Clostridium botulinum]HDK7138530.1 Crp/Fnr family transcriptional regulator [Clostridium botulinum]HDK7141859.1 Crp/Fnr family transcriptional regulator [Clostridium botulinum]HDK7146325.1 Crp/Fnr family transcriptional regulator [Clostridium botulinum]HDK7150030.1 Crp/Fnr family transcriptional regulator [Clostridium botulinum]
MKECTCGRCHHNICARKVPIFSSLSGEELIKIVNMTGHEAFKKGETICNEGDKSETLVIINEGKVKLCKLTKEGKEQIIHILSSGDFFGELNLFNDNESYNFSAYAISDVKICTLTKNKMDEILLKNPDISLKILKEVTRRLAETETLAQNLATNDADIRIANMILDFGEKYGVNKEQYIEIKLPINREEMANYVGVTRETISRKLSKFEDLDIIKLVGNKVIIIKNEDALKEFIE